MYSVQFTNEWKKLSFLRHSFVLRFLALYLIRETTLPLLLLLLVVVVIVVVVVLVVVVVITFMQGIYNYIPETNYVSRVYFCTYSIVTIYTTCNVTYHVGSFVLSTFFSECAVSSVAVFCSALTSCLLDMLLRYF
jgi:hypothetical protein